MTYLQFHLIFTIPAILLMAFLVRKRFRPAHLWSILLVCVIAFLATTPWDNWAVYRGIWGFDWERVTAVEISAFGKEFRLPAEEYAFFILMSVMVCLTAVFFLPKPGEKENE